MAVVCSVTTLLSFVYVSDRNVVAPIVPDVTDNAAILRPDDAENRT